LKKREEKKKKKNEKKLDLPLSFSLDLFLQPAERSRTPLIFPLFLSLSLQTLGLIHRCSSPDREESGGEKAEPCCESSLLLSRGEKNREREREREQKNRLLGVFSLSLFLSLPFFFFSLAREISRFNVTKEEVERISSFFALFQLDPFL